MRRPIYNKFALPITLALVFTLTFSVVRPQYQKLRDSRASLAQEKAKLDKLEMKLNALEALDEIKLQEKVAFALKALPAKKDVFRAMEVIDRLTGETGVMVEELTVKPGEISEEGEVETKAEADKQKLSFRLELSGTKEQLRLFLERLGEFIPLAETKKVSLGSSEGVGTSEFTLELYFSPLPEKIGKIEDPLPELTSEEEEIFEKISTLPYYVSEAVLTPAGAPSGRTNPFIF